MDFKNLFSHHLPFKRYFRSLHLSSYVIRTVHIVPFPSWLVMLLFFFFFRIFLSSFFRYWLTKWKIECLFCELLYRLCLIYDPCFGLRECIKTDYTMSSFFLFSFFFNFSYFLFLRFVLECKRNNTGDCNYALD